jgi:hypothetical protein
MGNPELEGENDGSSSQQVSSASEIRFDGPLELSSGTEKVEHSNQHGMADGRSFSAV